MSNEDAKQNPNAGIGKAELESKIRAMDAFRSSVREGSFPGRVAAHIGALLNLLDNEHAAALAEYEAQMSAHPEWGRPNDLPAGSKA